MNANKVLPRIAAVSKVKENSKDKKWAVIFCSIAALAGFVIFSPSVRYDSVIYPVRILNLIVSGEVGVGELYVSIPNSARVLGLISIAMIISAVLIEFFADNPKLGSGLYFTSAIASIPLIKSVFGIAAQCDDFYGEFYTSVDNSIGFILIVIFAVAAGILMLLQDGEISELFRKKRVFDKLMRASIWICAGISVIAAISIVVYILSNGLPYVFQEGFLSRTYDAGADSVNKGIFPMIINTLYLVIITLLIAVPIGVCTAIYLTQYAKQGFLVKAIRFTTDTLAGIPSIIYGLFGFAFFVTLCNLQYSLFAGSLALSLMILPTIIRTTEEALRSVPNEYKEGGFALGAGKLKTLTSLVLPNAMSGILASVILAVGRIVGETAVLIFTAGIAVKMPVFQNLGDIIGWSTRSGRSLSVHMYQVAMLGGEGANEHAFATASVLLIIVFTLNFIARHFMKGRKNDKG